MVIIFPGFPITTLLTCTFSNPYIAKVSAKAEKCASFIRWEEFNTFALAILVQLLFTYTPFMNFIFETEAISFGFWSRILSGMIVLYALVEVNKWLQYRRQSK